MGTSQLNPAQIRGNDKVRANRFCFSSEERKSLTLSLAIKGEPSKGSRC